MSVRKLLSDLPGPAARARLAIPTLQNKTCIVTGGSQGIGAAIASRFASEGAHVTIVGRKPETLKQACAEISVFRTSESQNIHAFEGDVRQDQTWSELLKSVVWLRIPTARKRYRVLR
jgi:NAD(P)-dependent dehydrogenase (short-subunit alcohol dehydrogenase family)